MKNLCSIINEQTPVDLLMKQIMTATLALARASQKVLRRSDLRMEINRYLPWRALGCLGMNKVEGKSSSLLHHFLITYSTLVYALGGL